MSEADPPDGNAAFSSFVSAPTRQRRPLRLWDSVLTSILLVVAFCLVVATLGLMSWGQAGAEYSCQTDPSTCDESLMENLRFELLVTVTWLTFGAAVILSIVFLKLRWYAFYIPILGGVLILAESAIWNQLVLSAY